MAAAANVQFVLVLTPITKPVVGILKKYPDAPRTWHNSVGNSCLSNLDVGGLSKVFRRSKGDHVHISRMADILGVTVPECVYDEETPGQIMAFWKSQKKYPLGVMTYLFRYGSADSTTLPDSAPIVLPLKAILKHYDDGHTTQEFHENAESFGIKPEYLNDATMLLDYNVWRMFKVIKDERTAVRFAKACAVGTRWLVEILKGRSFKFNADTTATTLSYLHGLVTGRSTYTVSLQSQILDLLSADFRTVLAGKSVVMVITGAPGEIMSVQLAMALCGHVKVYLVHGYANDPPLVSVSAAYDQARDSLIEIVPDGFPAIKSQHVADMLMATASETKYFERAGIIPMSA